MQFNNINVQDYFDSLPKMIQESIRMSGVTFNNKQDLEKFVYNLERRNI